jgi:hypothetical protein
LATTESPEWINASTVAGSSIWATVEEMEELSQIAQALADRFEDRRSDPRKRAAGARPVRVFTAVHLDVAKEERPRRWPCSRVGHTVATPAGPDEIGLAAENTSD